MGLGGSADGWPPFFVDRLAKTHRVITFDNAGAGRSTPAPAGKLSIRSMADDTASLVKALKLGRPDVMGWSMGSMIAQSYAVRHPTRIRRLILAATAAGNGKATFPAADAVGDLTAALAPKSHPEVLPNYLKAMQSYDNPVPAGSQAVFGQQSTAIGVWMGGQDPDGKRVGKLTLPTLIGAGGQDRLLPLGNDKTVNKLIKGSKLKVYADAAHGFFLQHPAAFAAEVLRFLR